MAVSSKFTQKSLFGGGSTKSNTPKIDTSYGANLGGGQQNNIVNLPTLSGGGTSGGLTAANKNVLKKALGNTPTVTIPQNLTYQNNLKNMTGIVGQGGASGGVTDEGVIVGNPNVEKMPTINRTTASGSKPQTSPMTYGQQLAAAAQQQTPTESTPDTSGGTGATGSTGSTGGSTAGSGEVDTYEEFLLKQEGFYKEQLDKLNAQIEQNKQNALQQAESERERAVIDARSSYAQNLAAYGANAEQLAAMGLSGSGYSDYLNQQAYATQRAETQNANAQAEATKVAAEQQANSDKLNAELSYAENMQNNAEKLAQYQQQKAEEAKAEEEQKKQYYAALLASANTGEYTSDQLASLGAQYGLDEVQISQLQAAAADKTSDTFFNSGSMSATEAKKQLDNILNNEWTSEENKKALQKTYDRLYKVVTNDVRFNNDGGWWIFGSTDMGSVGNNFSLIDDSGFKYRIESGGEVTDTAIKSLANDIADGSVFGVRNQIYYKKDGKVYLVQKRESSYGDHYTKLYNKFFG